MVGSLWRWPPLILSLSISKWWFLHQELEPNFPPLKSGLALVTHLTNSMWWNNVIEFLRIGHQEPCGFTWIFGNVCPWDILSQNMLPGCDKPKLNGGATHRCPGQQPPLYSYAAISINCQVHDQTTLDIASSELSDDCTLSCHPHGMLWERLTHLILVHLQNHEVQQ